MVIFVTSLKPILSECDNEISILASTISSINRQTLPDYRIIVTCERGDKSKIPDFLNTEVIEGPASDKSSEISIPHPTSLRLSYEWVRIDKGCKLIIAIDRARMYYPEYIFIFDYDDLISKRLVARAKNANPRNGIVYNYGYVWNVKSSEMRAISNFNLRCGTSLLIKASLLDFPKLEYPKSHVDILQTCGYQYVTRIYGSHRYAANFFDLEESNDRIAVYRVEHGSNHSALVKPFDWNRLGGEVVPLATSIIDDFGIHSVNKVDDRETSIEISSDEIDSSRENR